MGLRDLLGIKPKEKRQAQVARPARTTRPRFRLRIPKLPKIGGQKPSPTTLPSVDSPSGKESVARPTTGGQRTLETIRTRAASQEQVKNAIADEIADNAKKEHDLTRSQKKSFEAEVRSKLDQVTIAEARIGRGSGIVPGVQNFIGNTIPGDPKFWDIPNRIGMEIYAGKVADGKENPKIQYSDGTYGDMREFMNELPDPKTVSPSESRTNNSQRDSRSSSRQESKPSTGRTASSSFLGKYNITDNQSLINALYKEAGNNYGEMYNIAKKHGINIDRDLIRTGRKSNVSASLRARLGI